MQSAPTIIQRWQSQDIDEQSDMLRGWEQQYRQLSCGKFLGTVSTAHGPRITIVGERTNQSLHESVVPPEDSLVFGLVLNRDNALQVGRRHVTTSSLLVLEGGKEYDFRTDGSTELLGVAMESSMFTDLDGGCHSVVRRALKQNVVPLAPTATMMLRHFWLMMAQIVQNEDTWPSSMPMSLLADSALNNVLLALDMSTMQQSQPLPPSTERQALVVRHAIRYMKTHLDQHFTMADVCEATHVSQRTLQYHFEHCLDMSPQQYLKAMRLNAARSLLRKHGRKRSQCPPSIAEIAALCGYGHPSRFAGDYRQQFGVLPSETFRLAADGE